MNRKTYLGIFAVLLCLTTGALTSCSSSSSTPPPPTVAIAATSGSAQTAVVGAAFAAPLVATVTTGGSPTSGVSVIFTAPGSGASGTFNNGTATETDTTDANGLATSSAFTANSTAGAFAVTASATGASGTATFSLTNTTTVVTSTAYSFYLSGNEALNEGPNYLAIAGSVTIDENGNVLGGEQDYNDAFGITSPEPSGDTITGGTLSVDPTTGQGTLTLITNNTNVGASGTETFGVQFANNNHALIMQYDGSATSSGSIDLQTLPSTLAGGYAFTVSGVDNQYASFAAGGVFTISGASLSNGILDYNDDGIVSTGNTLTSTLSGADSFGRGSFTDSVLGISFVYYVVGPEVIRLIDVDGGDSAVGSAFGQGANATAATNASLSSSVLSMANGAWVPSYTVVGQLATGSVSDDPASFTGVAEDSELDYAVVSDLATPISGQYSIQSNGYGSLAMESVGFGDVADMGVYLTDPALNLSDPNNTSGGGGALVLDLDDSLSGGAGVLIPQSDTSTASFTGNYAAGWQDVNEYGCESCELEFDMLSQGSMTEGTLSLTGLVSDPFATLGTPDATSSGNTFTGAPQADGANAGRYTMLSTNETANPLATSIDGGDFSFDLVMYQASGGQLFWMQYDSEGLGVFSGPLQQQGDLSGLPQRTAKKRGASKPLVKKKK